MTRSGQDDPGRSPRDRSRARAWAVEIHYRWETEGTEGTLRDALVDTQHSRRIATRRLPYIRRILDLLDERRGEIDAALEESLDNWTLERLSIIDRGILRVACAEMLFLDDIPPKVSIQEAVRLGERYGGNDSARFVNGVLDALWKRTRVEE